MRIDLHMHSTASDGAKTPAELVRYCFETCGVGTMALTDHDTVAGVAEARRTAQLCGMRFVNGIEVSTIWSQRSVHIVGLGVDDNNAELLETTADLCDKRDRRAVEMGRKLEALGYPGMFEKALGKTRVKANVSRLHFAQALLEAGAVKNIQEAFDRYLTEGKPAYVAAAWPSVAEAVALIHRAGGVAVLAHPGRYRFKNDWQLDALVEGFVDAGGEAIEIVSGSQSPAFVPRCIEWAKRYHLYGSVGSDYHSPSGERPTPGAQGELPAGIPCVLQLLA